LSVRHKQRVLLHDARRDAHVLGVGAVVEEQVLAEVLLSVTAEETVVAGGGVERQHAVAHAEPGDTGTHLYDYASQLVAEDHRGLQHHGVVSAAVDLEVGAAGEGRAHAQEEFARADRRNGNPLHAQVLAAI
jgi:hypothetical protein